MTRRKWERLPLGDSIGGSALLGKRGLSGPIHPGFDALLCCCRIKLIFSGRKIFPTVWPLFVCLV